MDAIIERCAGLDVHQRTVVACILYGPLDRKPKQLVRTFGTTTRELLSLLDWLTEYEVTHVAMESSGVYWKPVWNILEGDFTLILANAQRIKNVPGRKTDVNDAVWIAQLLRCGLIESSMVPPKDIRRLRDYTRYRRKLLSAATSEKNRIHKVLQDANIKLTTFMSDVFGVSGRALLQALVKGKVLQHDQVQSMVHTHLKKKVPALVEALNGRVDQHHRKMIQYHLNHLDFVEKQIAEIEYEIEQLLIPYREEMGLLNSIPGIDKNAAAAILAETGVDMSKFPTEPQIASWGGVCPGNHESAGKKKSTRTRKSNRTLKAILCQVAHVNARSQNRISAFFHRIRKRRGALKAVVATAHLILRIIYHILKNRIPYHELGPEYDKAQKPSVHHWVQKIKQQGYEVFVTPVNGLP